MDPKFISAELNKLRAAQRLSMRALCRDLKLNNHSARKIFAGNIRNVRDKALLRTILEHLGSSEECFFGSVGAPTIPTAINQSANVVNLKIPVYGEIPAGAPTVAESAGNVQEWVEPPSGIRANNVFALRVTGNSMVPRFMNGDVVFLEPLNISLGIKDPDQPVPQLTFERLNGRVVAALVDQESTLKQLIIHGSGKNYELELRPFNPEFVSHRVRPDQSVTFQGVAIKTVRNEF